jgi:hypothetical protein
MHIFHFIYNFRLFSHLSILLRLLGFGIILLSEVLYIILSVLRVVLFFNTRCLCLPAGFNCLVQFFN